MVLGVPLVTVMLYSTLVCYLWMEYFSGFGQEKKTKIYSYGRNGGV